MTVIVTDAGFATEPAGRAYAAPHDLPPGSGLAVTLGPGDGLAGLAERLGDLALIRIEFAAFSDGRGFSLAHTLRQMGYAGRLRAAGHVIADQYAMARRSGFDEVEIDDTLAARQPEAQWLRRADWRAHDYQSRLGRRIGA